MKPYITQIIQNRSCVTTLFLRKGSGELDENPDAYDEEDEEEEEEEDEEDKDIGDKETEIQGQDIPQGKEIPDSVGAWAPAKNEVATLNPPAPNMPTEQPAASPDQLHQQISPGISAAGVLGAAVDRGGDFGLHTRGDLNCCWYPLWIYTCMEPPLARNYTDKPVRALSL